MVRWEPLPSLPSSWLPVVWKFFRSYYESDLSPFTSLPVLPLDDDNDGGDGAGQSTAVVRLASLTLDHCVVILHSAVGCTLSSGVVTALQLLGACVTDGLPEYVRCHAAVVGNYVRLPLSQDIVQVMFNAYQLHSDAERQVALEAVRCETSAAQKADIRDMIARLELHTLDTCHVRFLRTLPIFECLRHSSSEEAVYRSVQEVSLIAPVKHISFPLDTRYLTAADDQIATKAAEMLGARFVSIASMLKSQLASRPLDEASADCLSQLVFDNFPSYYADDSSIVETLSAVSFVRTARGHLAAPSALFDPECVELRLLMPDADVFPADSYSEVLQHMRTLGLKALAHITADDLLQTMIRIEKLGSCADTFASARASSLAVIRYLDSHSECLWHQVNGQSLLQWAGCLRWVAVVTDRPAMYPESLAWAGSEALLHVPTAVTSDGWAPVVGSVQPVVSCSAAVARVLSWDQQPTTVSIISHLRSIVASYRSAEKAQYLALLMGVYESLSRSAEAVMSPLSSDSWVWHGDGFVSVRQMLLRRSAVDLRPYVYMLPAELESYRQFFHSCGATDHATVQTYIAVLNAVSHKYDTAACDSVYPSEDAAADIQLSINILNQLAVEEPANSEDCGVVIPVLCEVGDSGVPPVKLLPAAECTYCDVDWLRRGFEFTNDDEDVHLVHSQLPVATAAALGVPTLMSRMLQAEELTVTSFGQAEPLTDRLRKLLQDYSDGLAIPKEIIQNADDAGASEVRFMYDERANEDVMKYLIDEGMRCCQGPALWAYNDAVFTDRDFESIVRLGGATKESEPDKIGKFGLGFNAVYNVTDVPSFVTRNMLVIFDPHRTHLGHGIKDCSRPGIKINLDRNRMLLRRLPDQFHPYNGVFGCRLNCDDGEPVYFDGTLFRLPLRTEEQACHSEISRRHYNRAEVSGLVQLTAKTAHHLLTFTQNVRRLSFYHVAAGGDPTQPALLLDVSKDLVQIVRELQPANNDQRLKTLAKGTSSDEHVRALSVNSGILHAAANYMSSLSASKKATVEPPRSSVVLKMTVNSVRVKGLQLEVGGVTETYWLVSSVVGCQRSLEIARQMRQGFVPAGSVACPLRKSSDADGRFLPTTLGLGPRSRGRAYCYLPLPVVTGLPVHVNGVFALHSDRRQLSRVTEDDKTSSSPRVDWNNALLEDAVAGAYLQLLSDLVAVIGSPDKDISLQDLWPVRSLVEPSFSPLVSRFYQCVVAQKYIPLLCRRGVGVEFEHVVFLDRSLASVPTVGPLAFRVLSTCCAGKAVSVISDAIYQSFVGLGLEGAVDGKLFQKKKFYKEVFFPKIDQFPAAVRDPLVLYALDQSWSEALIKEHPCIPSSPDGSVLRRPCDLVRPGSKVACLYSAEDGRFPHGAEFLQPRVLTGLERVGLVVNELGWHDVLERCASLEAVWTGDRLLAGARQRALLLFIDQLLLGAASESVQDGVRETLRNVRLLCVRAKPFDYPLRWAGDEHADELMPASDLFTADCQYLVSATCCIVDDSALSTQVCRFLQLGENVASVQHVMTQLEHVLNADIQQLSSAECEELRRCLLAVYGYLEEQCQTDESTFQLVRDILASRPCILLDRELVTPNVVATNVPYSCAPYLYALPAELASRYPVLMNAIGVRSTFDVGDYMAALGQLSTASDGKPLAPGELDVAVKLVAQLNSTMKQSGVTAEQVERGHAAGPIMVPNAHGSMCAASSLCYNDCAWLTTDASLASFAHSDITYRQSSCLGVRTKREEALRHYSRGIPFGQKERLTNSVRRLLDSYPFDHELLKELIQNADDAGASRVHFVVDRRRHADRRVFESSWRALQGPALCVFNDRPFGDADIDGIQRFGEGSKTSDPAATGQYGVGFSSVYHLTDAPLLLASSADAGGSKMLCVFDPMCRYVPGATPAEPGMRYDDVDALRKAFPDVFTCFLEDQFPDNGTMFRFPLRGPEMAEKSAISKKVITPDHVLALLDKLKEELFEILLFTNHLQQISISEVDASTGSLTNTYTCSGVLSSDDDRARNCLAVAKRKMADVVKMDSSVALSAGPAQCTLLTLSVTDSRGCQEKWIVAHRLGFDADFRCPPDVESAFSEGDLALLPHGSVACLVERRLHGRVDSSSSRPGRAFCFLPLPAETGLPVHVNGHFALGYENRRHLWTNADKAGGFKRQWNDLLCSEAIAAAYTDLLTALRLQLLNVTSVSDNVMLVTCSRPMLDNALHAYMSFFPTYSDAQPQWSVLTTSVYQYIEQNSLPLLASVCEQGVVQTDAAASTQTSELIRWQISWLPPRRHGTCRVFFRKSEAQPSQEPASQASLIGKFRGWFGLSSGPAAHEKSTEEILSDILLRCGLKLVESTAELYDNFRRAGVDVDYMTPESVLAFFESYRDKSSAGVLSDLPRKIEDTPFRDEKTLSLVVKYISSADNFDQRLNGLPLLLRADNVLDYFSSDIPIYSSEFCSLAPSNESLFMKHSYASAVNVTSECGVFREFGIAEMADLLPSCLPAEKYCSEEGRVVWNRHSAGGMPTLKWIRRLWEFLYSLVNRQPDLDADERCAFAESLIQPVHNWCVMPVRSHAKYHLYSPAAASTGVVDLSSSDSQQGIGAVVKRLQFPELDLTAMHKNIFHEPDPIRRLVVNLKKPYELLLLLHGRLTTHDSCKDKASFSEAECRTVLTYFIENVDKLSSHDDAARKLRDLPVFTTICGDIIQLSGCLVYTLPAKIPTNGIDVWQSRSGTVFLAREDDFCALYDFLGCASVGSLEVYCQFIFQHFEYFCYEDRLAHLHHVYANYLQADRGNITAEERRGLVDALQGLAFLEDENGELQRADYFYDPNNVVFQVGDIKTFLLFYSYDGFFTF